MGAKRRWVLCADPGPHSLVCLQVVYAQQHALLVQLGSCVLHWLCSLRPLQFSFSVHFNWPPRISSKIRTNHVSSWWQTWPFLAVQGAHHRSDPPRGTEGAAFCFVIVGDNLAHAGKPHHELLKGKLFSKWLKLELQTSIFHSTRALLFQAYRTKEPC